MVFGRLFCRIMGTQHDSETIEVAILVGTFWPLVLVAIFFILIYNTISKYVADPIFEKLNKTGQERTDCKKEDC